MKRSSIGVLVAAACVLLLSAVPASAQEPVTQATPDSVIYPILGWLPLYGADLSLPSGPPCVGCPPEPSTSSGSSSGLSGAWFAGGRLEFGRLELIGNWNYAGLSASKDAPVFNADVKLYTASILAGVRVYGPVFVEAGARYYGIHGTFTVLTFPAIDWDPGRWSPAIGGTVRPVLGKHWRLFTHIDWAGIGVSGVSTMNGEARIEWRPIRHFAVTGGYAFCRTTLDDTLLEGTSLARPVHLQQTLHGPVAGIGIPF